MTRNGRYISHLGARTLSWTLHNSGRRAEAAPPPVCRDPYGAAALAERPDPRGVAPADVGGQLAGEGAGGPPRPVTAPEHLHLEPSEEALHGGVVGRVAPPGHRAGDARPLAEPEPRPRPRACPSRAPPRGGPAPPGHHAPVVEVDHRRQVGPGPPPRRNSVMSVTSRSPGTPAEKSRGSRPASTSSRFGASPGKPHLGEQVGQGEPPPQRVSQRRPPPARQGRGVGARALF